MYIKLDKIHSVEQVHLFFLETECLCTIKDMRIGERIKNTRKKNKLTQSELAEKINVHEVTVRTWENTDKGLNSAVMTSLASALGTTVAYLIGETDDPEPKRYQGLIASPEQTGEIDQAIEAVKDNKFLRDLVLMMSKMDTADIAEAARFVADKKELTELRKHRGA